MTQDKRIDELEMKTSFQEQLITELNDELIRHGTRITTLEKQLEQLVTHLQSLQDKVHAEPQTDPLDERPPHY